MISPAYIGAIAATRVSAPAGVSYPRRYWRVLFTELENNAARATLSQLEFWDRRHARRVAGETILKSSEISTSPATEAMDDTVGFGSVLVQWVNNTTGPGAWLGWDFGAGGPIEIAAVALWRGSRSDSQYSPPTAWTVQASDDGSTWDDVWSDSVVQLPQCDATHASPHISENQYFTGSTDLVFGDAASAQHWMKLDDGVFSDAGATPAAAEDGIYQATNHGTDGTPFMQTSAGNRPVFKTGGLNGKPYLHCTAANQHKFADIAFSQPSSSTAANPFSFIAVTNTIDLGDFRALMGSALTNGGKAAVYFRPDVGGQHHVFKSSFRFGNVENPQISLFSVTAWSDMRAVMNDNQVLYGNNAGSAGTGAITAANLLWNDGLVGDGYYDGDLYELIIMPSVTGRAPMWRVREYLKAKYGL